MTSIIEFFKLVCIGLVLGITTVLPGLSAGTMAVVFNVYDRLIRVITPNVKKIIAAWQFWLPLVVGGLAGIFLFSRAVSFLYENHEIPTIWFFIGVIIGSLPLMYGRVKKPASKLPSLPSAVCMVLALAVMITMAIVTPAGGTALYTELTPSLIGMLILAGVLSAIALIVPGISGAFLLLVIGFHRTILQAVSDLNIPVLAIFMLGTVLGVFAGAALVRFLLSRAPRETYGAVLGLVVGSVIVLFPGGFGEGSTIIFSLLSLFAGAAISFFFVKTKGSPTTGSQPTDRQALKEE